MIGVGGVNSATYSGFSVSVPSGTYQISRTVSIYNANPSVVGTSYYDIAQNGLAQAIADNSLAPGCCTPYTPPPSPCGSLGEICVSGANAQALAANLAHEFVATVSLEQSNAAYLSAMNNGGADLLSTNIYVSGNPTQTEANLATYFEALITLWQSYNLGQPLTNICSKIYDCYNSATGHLQVNQLALLNGAAIMPSPYQPGSPLPSYQGNVPQYVNPTLDYLQTAELCLGFVF